MQRYLTLSDIAKLHKKSVNHLHSIASRLKIKPTHSIKTKCKGFGYDSSASYGSATIIKNLYDSLVFDNYFASAKTRSVK